MTGIFDSGVGGLTALRHLRALKPDEDICYFADTKNAPYGSKKESKIIGLVKNDIEILRGAGCDMILAACCTASAVIPMLPSEYQKGVTTIIEPAAKEAAGKTRGHIGVIATEATVRSRAFERAILAVNGTLSVTSVAAQPLVSMVEAGDRDGCCSGECREYIAKLLFELRGIDLIILGCTHFTHLEKTISDMLGVTALSPSLIGAAAVARSITSVGNGKTYYL